MKKKYIITAMKSLEVDAKSVDVVMKPEDANADSDGGSDSDSSSDSDSDNNESKGRQSGSVKRQRLAAGDDAEAIALAMLEGR